MIFVAVDIGLTGAIAAVDYGTVAQVADLPTVPDGKTRRLCGRELIRLLRTFVGADRAGMVVIEDVRPRAFGNGGKAQTNSMHSQGSMMRSRGIVEAACDIAGLQIKLVQPAVWKRKFGLIGQDKNAGREVALRLYPQLAADLKRVKDHNRADAVLIAHFAQMTEA